MKININEIPKEGKSWTLNDKTGELSDALRDLIGKNPYQTNFSITPLPTQGTFEIRGKISTKTPEQCSRCGIDFDFKINENFYYILIPEVSMPRDGKYSKPNHYSDLHEEAIETAEYQGNHFDVSEFFHELVAISIPTIPAPPPDENDNCSECKISLKNHSFSYDEGEAKSKDAFDPLKGIKLN